MKPGIRKRTVGGEQVTVERRKGSAPIHYGSEEAAAARRDEVEQSLQRRRRVPKRKK